MVVRDADLLAELGERAGVHGLHQRADRRRGGVARARARHGAPAAAAARGAQLRDAGVNAGVLMAPVVPGFTTQPARLEATVKAIADHGAAFVGANVMFLKGGTRDHFMRFLAQRVPALVEGYERLYAGAYAPSRYVDAVRGLIGTLQRALRCRRGEQSRRNRASVDAASPTAAASESRRRSSGERLEPERSGCRGERRAGRCRA